MSKGKKGTSNLNTITRAVASIGRSEPDEVRRAAVTAMLRAYDAEDHRAGRRCLTDGCATCGGPTPPDSGTST